MESRDPLHGSGNTNDLPFSSGKSDTNSGGSVFNSTRGSGYLPLPAEEEDPLGGYIFAFRLPES